ncbi:MAG: hypothetical protein ACK411_15260, partial [Exiguobacterium mexicanum]
MNASHERLMEREEQLDAFHHHIKQLRHEANDSVEKLHASDLDFSYEQAVFNTLRQLQELF